MGVIVTVVVGGMALNYLDAHNPRAATPVSVSRPAPLAVAPPAVVPKPHATGLIGGPRVLSYGGSVTLSGNAESGGGYIRVRGSWNLGPWQTLAVTEADGSHYSFTLPLNHRGTLRLRVVHPNGYVAVGTYRVS